MSSAQPPPTHQVPTRYPPPGPPLYVVFLRRDGPHVCQRRSLVCGPLAAPIAEERCRDIDDGIWRSGKRQAPAGAEQSWASLPTTPPRLTTDVSRPESHCSQSADDCGEDMRRMIHPASPRGTQSRGFRSRPAADLELHLRHTDVRPTPLHTAAPCVPVFVVGWARCNWISSKEASWPRHAGLPTTSSIRCSSRGSPTVGP